MSSANEPTPPLPPDTRATLDIGTIDISNVEQWRDPPSVTFNQAASLRIAQWVLWIFSGVYVLAFVLVFCSLRMQDATYDKTVDVLKFLVTSIVPLVTLAVGYYLGDKKAGATDSPG